MKIKCLVLDHDDTLVRSAETVNFPALLESLQENHPDRVITYEEFNRYCFQMQYTGMCRNILKLTDEEIDAQFERWKVYVRTHVPPAYDGIREILQRARAEGCLICVSSHSGVENITRDYRLNFHMEPDAIYAWELGEALRKPHPFTLQDIMRRYSLRPDELLLVDDMKGGYDMAKACHVPFACAGWSHDLLEIRDFMKQNCDIYFETVEDFKNYLFGT